MRCVFLWCLLLAPWVAVVAAPPSRGVLVLGDSLSAAYGISIESGWVALLKKRVLEHSAVGEASVINASISGETTAGGLARLPELLEQYRPGIVIVELGANDALRGLLVEEVRANLRHILALSRNSGAKVLLVGMEIPINYGPRYRDSFRAMYRDLATEFNVAFVPFLLEGVALDPALMQDDGLHPKAAAEPKVFETVWMHLKPLLEVASP